MSNCEIIELSRIDKDLITVSKKLGFLYRELDAFYKYRCIVADYIGCREFEVTNQLLLKKLGKTFNNLIHLGYIELPPNFNTIEELYFDLLINFKSSEDILDYFISSIQWLVITEHNIDNLINIKLFELDLK